MMKAALKARDLALLYLKWGWPLLLLDAALGARFGGPAGGWRSALNTAAFLWVLCAHVAPLSLLFSRERRERAMARFCGLREGDERERSVTGEAARSTLLFGLALQTILLLMSVVSVRLSWNPGAPRGERGVLSVGMGFSSSRHLNPLGGPPDSGWEALSSGAASFRAGASEAGGFLLAPSSFPVLALLILIQLAAFRLFAARRYEGLDA